MVLSIRAPMSADGIELLKKHTAMYPASSGDANYLHTVTDCVCSSAAVTNTVRDAYQGYC